MKSEMYIKRKGITLKVSIDYSYDHNPREDEHLGTMTCFHRRYKLGDNNQFKNYDEFKDFLDDNRENIMCIMPLYLYDHSGITISTTPFGDIWDSGQVGFIYCTKERAKSLGFEQKDMSKIKTLLLNEVKEYDEYLQGYPPYYYFCLRDENDNIIDSLSGFKGGNLKDMLSDMQDYAEDKYKFLFKDLLKKENENYL